MTTLTPGQFTSADAAMSYLQAGQATITIRSKRTQTRYTYKVQENDDGRIFFVSVLYGPENTTDYRYLGIIHNGVFRRTAKSKLPASDPRYVAFQWTYQKLSGDNGALPAELEIWHEGHCGWCGRALTVPESIASGFGPECSRKIRREAPGELDAFMQANVVPLRRTR